MKQRLIFWISFSQVVEASAAGFLLWLALNLFLKVELLYVLLILLFLNFFRGLRRIDSVTRLPLEEARQFLRIDMVALALATIKASLFGFLLTLLVSLVAWWLSSRTGRRPDEFHIWILFACLFFLVFRFRGRQIAREAALPDSDTTKQVAQTLKKVEGNLANVSSLTALVSAIIIAASKCRDRMMVFVHPKTQQEKVKSEMYVFFEFLYFFLYMTDRAAHSRLKEVELDRIRQIIYPSAIAATINLLIPHWPQKYKTGITKEFYENLNAAVHEYSASTELRSLEWKPLTDESLLNKLARNVAEKMGSPYNPEVLRQASVVVLEELENLPRLIDAAIKEI